MIVRQVTIKLVRGFSTMLVRDESMKTRCHGSLYLTTKAQYYSQDYKLQVLYNVPYRNIQV